MVNNETGTMKKLSESDTTTDILIYSFGDEYYSVYKNCQILFRKYLSIILESIYSSDADKAYEEFVIAGSKLQQLLRGKLLALRD